MPMPEVETRPHRSTSPAWKLPICAASVALLTVLQSAWPGMDETTLFVSALWLALLSIWLLNVAKWVCRRGTIDASLSASHRSSAEQTRPQRGSTAFESSTPTNKRGGAPERWLAIPALFLISVGMSTSGLPFRVAIGLSRGALSELSAAARAGETRRANGVWIGVFYASELRIEAGDAVIWLPRTIALRHRPALGYSTIGFEHPSRATAFYAPVLCQIRPAYHEWRLLSTHGLTPTRELPESMPRPRVSWPPSGQHHDGH